MHLIEGGHSTEAEGAHVDHRYLEDDHDHADHADELMLGDTPASSAQDEHAEHDDVSESLAAAKFGMAILGGFLLPIALSLIFHFRPSMHDVESIQADDDVCESCKAEDVETGISVTAKEDVEAGDCAVIHKIDDDSPGRFDEADKTEVRADQPLVTKTFINYLNSYWGWISQFCGRTFYRRFFPFVLLGHGNVHCRCHFIS